MHRQGAGAARRRLREYHRTHPFHQLDARIEAHVFISFLAYCLHVTFEKHNKKASTGLSSRSVLKRMSEVHMLDATIPASDGRELRMKRHTKPGKVHELLLDRLHPARPAPARNPESEACGGDLLRK